MFLAAAWYGEKNALYMIAVVWIFGAILTLLA